MANNSFDVDSSCFEKIDELATSAILIWQKSDYMEGDEDFEASKDDLLEELKSQSSEPIDDLTN